VKSGCLSSEDVSQVLFQSLIEAPALVEDLPEGAVFASEFLGMPPREAAINLQQKLGYLYEDALAMMLEATPQYDLLERGIQLRKEAGHTLGELDFLVRDLASARLIHLELAVKFYLAVETESGFLLPGPDARDNYFRKLEKMRSHQLMLVQKYRELLPERFREQEIVVKQLVHGCIFDHVNASRPVEAEFLNPNGRRGKWLHAYECAGHFGKDSLLEVIPKSLWPVPLDILAGLELEKWELDENMNRCEMIRAHGCDFPYFIAPNGYPEKFF
jgi:hypothetical protein